MPTQLILLPSLNRIKSLQIIGISLLILVTVFLFFQGLFMNIKFENPITKQPGLIGYFRTIIMISSIILAFSVFIARFYRSKYVDQIPLDNNALFQSNQIEIIKNVRGKVIIGLENVN